MSNKINFLSIMETKREEIVEKIKQAKRKAEHVLQGWHVNVEIDENDVWVTGLMSCGSKSMSSYNGTSYVVASISTWQVEIQESELIKDSEVYAEFEAQKEDGYEYAWEFMQEKYPDILKNWKDEALEYEIDNMEADEILDEAIEQYKLELENRIYY